MGSLYIILYPNVLFWTSYLKYISEGVEFLSRDIPDVESSTEASVPTPLDQEDVSPIYMVSGAVREIMDKVRDVMGIEDYSTNNK